MVVGNLKEELGIRKLVRRTGRRNGRFTNSSYVLPSVFFFFFPGLTVDLSGYGQLGSHVLIFCSVQYQTELRFGLLFGRLSGKLKGVGWFGMGWSGLGWAGLDKCFNFYRDCLEYFYLLVSLKYASQV